MEPSAKQNLKKHYNNIVYANFLIDAVAQCLLKPRLYYASAFASLMAHPQLADDEASGPLAGCC